MIFVENLTKRYGSTRALDGVSFSVEKGEILGLLGPNGAGKSTTMNILACFLHPSEGQAVVAGFDCVRQPLKVTARIGYLPEIPPLYEAMRVQDYVRFAAEIKGVAPDRLGSRIDYALEATGVEDRRRSLISALSKGFRQRLGLAAAIVHDPEVLILDEPTIGLDPNQIVEIRRLIKDLASSRTVILSTHILPEVELVCNRAAIIHEGRIAAIDTISKLRDRFRGSQILELEIAAEDAVVERELGGLRGVIALEKKGAGREGTLWVLEAGPDTLIRRTVFETAAKRNWVLLEMRSRELRLEQVFAELTREDAQ